MSLYLRDSNHNRQSSSCDPFAVYAEDMFRFLPRCFLIPAAAFIFVALLPGALAQNSKSDWYFAVSGDSRNCGDFVMPAIAAKVKAENDDFYWHLGDFRWMTQEDQDFLALQSPRVHFSIPEYQQRAWDDFLVHQMASFVPTPVFLGRGNHDAVSPMTREAYIQKFSSFLDRPEIAAQRSADGQNGAPIGPWYHWIHNGVDFITLDNATHDEFTQSQLHWLQGVLERDEAPHSGVRAVVAGMHEALPHSTGAEHAMDDWAAGMHTGEQVYRWFWDAQAVGLHVYLLASHSHYYSPDIFNTPYWRDHATDVVPGWIIGAAGAHRYRLPKDAKPGAKTHFYGYLRGTVHADGTIDFTLRELNESDLVKAKWPNAPLDAIHECFIHNADE